MEAETGQRRGDIRRNNHARRQKGLANVKQLADDLRGIDIVLITPTSPYLQPGACPYCSPCDTLHPFGARILGVFSYPLAAAHQIADPAVALAAFADALGTPYLMIGSDYDLPFAYCMQLREMGFILINNDENSVDPRNMANLGRMAKCDATISYDPKADRYLRGLGVVPLSFGISLNYCGKFTPVSPASPRPVDVMFVGSSIETPYSGPRLSILNTLRSKGVPVACWGMGFQVCEELFGGPAAELPYSPETGCVPSVLEYYQRAKIGINFDFVHKDRTFKIVLAGALLVCTDTPQIRDLFTPGEEIVVFTTLDELAEKCRYYLAHETERLAIARRGHEKALSLFQPDRIFKRTYERFVQDIASLDPDRTVEDLTRAAGVVALTGELDAPSALDYLRQLPRRFGAAHAYAETLLGMYTALPAEYQAIAGKRAEKALLAACRAGDFDLAALLLPICLNTLYFHSRLAILQAAIQTRQAQGRDCADLADILAACLRQYQRQCQLGASLAEPFAEEFFLREKLRRKLIQGKKLAIFGAGGNGRAWKRWVEASLEGVSVTFVDNDPAKQGKVIDGAPVHAKSRLREEPFDYILIASTWKTNIACELGMMGFEKGRDFEGTLHLPCAFATERPGELHGK
ncbi:glycosyltransferase [Solidesulfovibrio alcoholivorans]|uniref:glycosyltransferase n=1 Tax=Solidesulfovibrio alcoholivorans TaxID=81406 RepID=UPI000497339D|nr:glycosyltransferase [Solidesulfovibrio alcoholivorans]